MQYSKALFASTMENRRSSTNLAEGKPEIANAGSDTEEDRGGKQAKYDEGESDNDSNVSSSNSSSATSTATKRGVRGKRRKKRKLAFKCSNFLKVNLQIDLSF